MDIYIEGTIEIDGVVSTFSIGNDGEWQQWGAPTSVLGQRVDLVDAMAQGLMQEELL